MFKKIEIWILYLVVLLGMPVIIGFGVLVRQEMSGRIKFGMVSKFALFLAEMPVNFKDIIKDSDLTVEDRFPSLSGFNGTPNSNETYLLLSRYNGDIKEGIVELVDLKNFEVLHIWNPNIDEFNKLIEKNAEFKYINRDRNNSRQLLHHPKLTKDGGLLIGWELPLRKIDACANLIFQKKDNIYHHSIETDINGNIWVPSRIYPQSLSTEKVGRDAKLKSGYLDDGIVKLSPTGEVLFEKSVSQIFIDNDLEYLLFGMANKILDPIHLNDIQPVDFDGEFWRKGDVFLSLRHQSMVLLYRPSSNKIIWKGTGPFFHQHDIDILNEFEISIFNNNSKEYAYGDVVDGHNEVIIYNFQTNEYSSYLSDSLINNDVRTITAGRTQILPNGDLFIEETNFARTLYFNSDGSLRWTYLNRADNGDLYTVGWSRIMYNKNDIEIVKNFLESRIKCDD